MYFCSLTATKNTLTVEQTSEKSTKRTGLYAILTVLVVCCALAGISYWVCSKAVKAEYHARYAGIMNIAAEKLAKTIHGMEMNAMNEFDEVEKHLDSPEAVITALQSKTSLNPEIRGYFAAFEPDYFPQKGRWFEPYVHHVDSSAFEVRLVGSARHNYFKSPGRLICVCGADMTFEWLAKELQRIDASIKSNEMLNSHLFASTNDFFTVVVNKDGSCIAGPEGKKVALTEEHLIRDLENGKSGTVDMTIDDVPSTVFYGPIEYVDWSVAIVVAKEKK